MLLLTGMLAAALWPRAANRINALPAARKVGAGVSRFVGRWYWLLFALALAVGLGVRIWRFGQLPLGLNQDGAMAGAEGLTLLRRGTDLSGASWPVYFEAWGYTQMSVLYSYFCMPFFALLGLSKFSLRLPMLLLSLAMLPVIWDFARRMAGRSYALLALWLTAICPWQIMQSRWALEANMMGHLVLLGCWLLYIGVGRKPLLYLSMAVFGLSMYTYGLTLYSVPVLLLLACVYLLRRGLIRWWEALLCAAVYFALAAPFFLMILINALGWATLHIGPLTLPFFPEAVRAEEIALFAPNPLAQMGQNLWVQLQFTLLQSAGDAYSAYPLTRTLYAFSPPALVCGIALLAARRRPRKDGQGQAGAPDPWGSYLVLAWLLAMLVLGLLTYEPNVNRTGAVYYPLILCLAYALYEICRRVRVFTLLVALLYALGFGSFCAGYFGDQAYIQEQGYAWRDGLYEALRFAWGLDTDRYYIDTTITGEVITELHTLVAHQIDGGQREGEFEVDDGLGRKMGYYRDRYVYMPFDGFMPDPESCSAYILRQAEAGLFPADEYRLWNFGEYTVAYPLYWLEE